MFSYYASIGSKTTKHSPLLYFTSPNTRPNRCWRFPAFRVIWIYPYPPVHCLRTFSSWLGAYWRKPCRTPCVWPPHPPRRKVCRTLSWSWPESAIPGACSLCHSMVVKSDRLILARSARTPSGCMHRYRSPCPVPIVWWWDPHRTPWVNYEKYSNNFPISSMPPCIRVASIWIAQRLYLFALTLRPAIGRQSGGCWADYCFWFLSFWFMIFDFFSSPQIAQIFTDYFISSLPIVIQRSIATKDLGASTCSPTFMFPRSFATLRSALDDK